MPYIMSSTVVAPVMFHVEMSMLFKLVQLRNRLEKSLTVVTTQADMAAFDVMAVPASMDAMLLSALVLQLAMSATSALSSRLLLANRPSKLVTEPVFQ